MLFVSSTMNIIPFVPNDSKKENNICMYNLNKSDSGEESLQEDQEIRSCNRKRKKRSGKYIHNLHQSDSGEELLQDDVENRSCDLQGKKRYRNYMNNLDQTDSGKESLQDDQETTTFIQDKDVQSDSTTSDAGGFSFCRLSRQKKFILISVCSSDCLSYLCLSLMAPFFPKEALSKHVNNTISGWIFGIFAAVQVVLFPIYGKILPRIGIKAMYLSGLFVGGCCTILFGFTTYIPTNEGPERFIAVCFLVRIVMATGCAAINTASSTLIIDEFPEHMATVFGIGEVFIGIGFMAGPAIGGFLYSIGGFVTPFSVIGGVLLLSVSITFWLIPNDKSSIQSEVYGTSSNFYCLLRSANFILTCLAIVVAAVIVSSLEPTLEPHLRKFELSPELVGVVFLSLATTYSISAPFWGYVTDKLPDNRMLIIPGLFLSAAGLLLLGPSTLLGFPYGYNELWLNIVALCLVSLFASASLVPTYVSVYLIAQDLGFKDDIHTNSMIAGLWQSMFSLGDFIGPSVGGWLFEEVGFQWETTFVAGACIFMVFSLSIKLIIELGMTNSKR